MLHKITKAVQNSVKFPATHLFNVGKSHIDPKTEPFDTNA